MESEMTQAVLTIDRAPRDKSELARVGRYQLHQLAEQLGALDTADTKVAWNRASQEQRVQLVHDLLLARDRNPAPPPQNASPSHMAARSVSGVPVVRPDAAAAARAATTPAPARGTQTLPAAGQPEVLATAHRVLEDTRSLCEHMTQRLERSSEDGEHTVAAVAALTKAIDALTDTTELALGLMVLLARRQLKIEPAAALTQARAAAREARSR
jgi:hypothetical protein